MTMTLRCPTLSTTRTGCRRRVAARATAQRFTAACATRPRRSEAARAAALSAPPPPAGNSLSPIYPTPKFSTKAEPAEKFGAPIEGADGNQSGSAPRAQD
jgi:hypothetical protein